MALKAYTAGSYGPLAQLVRAFALYAKCRVFESHRVYQYNL